MVNNGENSQDTLSYSIPFTDMLRRKAHDKQSEFDRLLHEQRRIKLQLQKIKDYITHLNGLLEVEGISPISLRDTSDATGFAKPGNRSKNMPLRKSEWDGMSLSAVVERILSESDEVYHADVLVERVYEIETEAGRKRAKHSLVGTLRQGVKAEKWQGFPGNKYQGLPAEQEALIS